MNTQIANYIDEHYTVITATNRLARFFRNNYAEIQVEKGLQSWQTPDVLPWTAWLQRLWAQQNMHNSCAFLLLNQHQQKLIWQGIIRSSAYSRDILHINALVNEVMSSYALCKAWHIPVFPDGYYLNDDSYAFKSWVKQYEQNLQEKHWLDIETLPDFMLEQGLEEQHCNNSIFCGFDFVTAQHQAMVNSLQELGFDAVNIKPERVNRTAQFNVFSDTDTEIVAAANYARQVCTTGHAEKIGIVAPNLEQERENIISIFQRVLQPANLLVDNAGVSAAFNVSLGKPLRQYAPVQTALTVLALGKRQINFSDLNILLHSAHIAGADKELDARAKLDFELRRSGERVWYKQNLLQRIEELTHTENLAAGFVNVLKEIELAILTHPGKHPIAEWVSLFSQLLDIAGWPGDRELNSEEYQLINAWNEGIERLTSLESLLGEIDYAQALIQLNNIINETRFQPETAESLIQILNITSAAAMQFDHLWVLGMHDAAWPPPVQNYPFIPAKLRDESSLPFASTSRNYEYARTLLETLIGSAQHVVLSFAHREKDFLRAPSPLIKEYTQYDDKELIITEDFRKLIQESVESEFIEDNVCTTIPQVLVNGGTNIFTDQARCPFRAFAKHRLNAESLPELSIGLDSMQRGSLIHLAMQFFWREIKSQKNLLDLSAERQIKTLEKCVNKAIHRELEQQPEIVNANFLQAESRRLVLLLGDWLDYERSRSPFDINATETKHSELIENIRCYMRIDRIDELADGSKVIIDYKTGAINIKNWFDERPEDPQLPIYAISNSEQLTAVAYAHVKQGECKFSGVSRAEYTLPDVKAYDATYEDGLSWERQLEEWRLIIQQLAQEFQQGVADVMPLNPLICRYCDLHTLCRVYEVGEKKQADEAGNTGM